MLQFNPYLRPNVEQCLASPYFDKVRGLYEVSSAPAQVDLHIENKDMSLSELREEFCLIVNDYQQSSKNSTTQNQADLLLMQAAQQ